MLLSLQPGVADLSLTAAVRLSPLPLAAFSLQPHSSCCVSICELCLLPSSSH